MTGKLESWTVRPISNVDLHRAVAGMLPPAQASPDLIDRHVQALRAYEELTGVQNTAHLGAYRGASLLAATLCFDHPGRTAMVFLPAAEDRDAIIQVVEDLLEAHSVAAARRGLALLQIIIEPGHPTTEAVAQRTGYQFLADLLYQECPVTIPAPPDTTGLEWLPYSSQTEELFLETIQRTYRNSRDCPLLIGRRQPRDVLEGHRGASHLDTQHWALAMEAGSPVAVLLLTRSPKQDNIEVVYMGVAAEARRRGLGRALLGRANRIAAETGARVITLAVDAANTPARSLYRAAGFSTHTQRRAWVRLLQPSP
jgi:ribosomal protein S18 acetylase RimI-like enzyme